MYTLLTLHTKMISELLNLEMAIGIKLYIISKEIKPVNPKENQPWVFIGRTDAEVGAPILWPPDSKSWLIWRDLDAGKDWRQIEKAAVEDTDSMDMNLSKLREIVENRGAWRATVHGVAKSQTQLSNRISTTLTITNLCWNFHTSYLTIFSKTLPTYI